MVFFEWVRGPDSRAFQSWERTIDSDDQIFWILSLAASFAARSKVCYGGGLLFSREMAVNESLSCDRNRFLVGISNLKKFGSFHVFLPVHMRNLIFSRDLKELFSRACDQKLIFE